MSKYVVTYKTLALHNSEIEVEPTKADEIREEIKKLRPVFGRDWDWTESEAVVTIEADTYSIAANGSAHFYRNTHLDNRKGVGDYKPELVTSITSPVLILKEEDIGNGKVKPGGVPWEPWNSTLYTDPVSFLAKAIQEQREAAERLKRLDTVIEDVKRRAGEIHIKSDIVERQEKGLSDSPPKPETPTVSVDLTFAELVLLRSGLTLEAQQAVKVDTAADIASARTTQGAVDSKLDAKLYNYQVMLKARDYGLKDELAWYKEGGFPPGTFEHKADYVKLTIRFRGKDLRTYQRQVNVPRNSDAYTIDISDEPLSNPAS